VSYNYLKDELPRKNVAQKVKERAKKEGKKTRRFSKNRIIEKIGDHIRVIADK